MSKVFYKMIWINPQDELPKKGELVKIKGTDRQGLWFSEAYFVSQWMKDGKQFYDQFIEGWSLMEDA